MNREEMLKQIQKQKRPWDLVIIGGGATGLGAAVDAASRGYRVLLLEQSDFAKGTSSRSTKLIHGGLRYLQQGDITLVIEALRERGMLCQNAPHLVHPLPFLVPSYHWWEGPFYGIGLKVYDLLAGKLGLESSKYLSKEETLKAIPTLAQEGLKGGVLYYDGQFDDARLAITLAKTCVDHGGVVINYMKVTGFIKKNGLIAGVKVKDVEEGTTYSIQARAVINATGVFSDALLKLDNKKAKRLIAPSQGIHLVLNHKFLPTHHAILVPHTEDKRVVFLVPWHDRVLVGTTDTPIQTPSLEPKARQEEIRFLLKHASKYLSQKLSEKDILSIFVGLRPLVKAGASKNTAALSRDHTILISESGLITIAGGKWTTYRKMAEDVIQKAILIGNLPEKPCVTKTLRLHGWKKKVDPDDLMSVYGTDAKALQALMQKNKTLKTPLHPQLPYLAAQAVWAVQNEMALRIEDVLARRTRALFLDAKSSLEAAPFVAKLMAKELKKNREWEKAELRAYAKLAKGYTQSDSKKNI